ncbi:hypothetical protein BLOT_000581 [Blomia tropicalis]|nr:hypothetical protein BLOT_000581 [Blomia tropicalis]
MEKTNTNYKILILDVIRFPSKVKLLNKAKQKCNYLPIGPLNSSPDNDFPSKVSINFLSGSSTQCNKQTKRCNGLSKATSNLVQIPFRLPVFV